MTSTFAIPARALLARLGACLLAYSIAGAAVCAELPVLRPGEWVEIPDSHLRDVAPPVSPGGSVAKIINAWSGAVLDTQREWLLVWGGGHSDYAGNELYAFDLRTLEWNRLTSPSAADRARTVTYTDGQPRARHTYNYIEYVPAWDRLVSFGGAGGWPLGGGEFTRQISEFDYEGRTWITGARPPVPPGGSMIAALARLDAATGDVYFVPAAKGAMLRLDPRTQQWQGGWGRCQVTAHASAAIDPERRLLVVVGKGTADGVRQAWKWDLTHPSAPVDLRKLTSGDFAVERAMAPGFVYHPPTRKFVGWVGGTDLLTLDPDTWQWQRVAAAPGSANPGMPSPRGTYGRFQYVPGLDAFVLVNDIDRNVLLVRPDFAGTGVGQGPAPAISLRADPGEVDAGEASTLSWTAPGADRCEAFGSWQGPREPLGTVAVSFEGQRAMFGLRCRGRGGESQASVHIRHPAPPSVSIAAQPAVVAAGGAATLTWEATATSRCAASGAWHGPRTAHGREVIKGIVAGAQFDLECEGDGGTSFAKAMVQVTQAPAPEDPVPPPDSSHSHTNGLGDAGPVTAALLLLLGALGTPRRRRSWPQ